MSLTGETRLAAVIGWPVRHSLSPTIFNAAFAALKLDWAFLAFEVPPEKGIGAVDSMRALGLAGLSVTMPHKAAVAAAVDGLTPAAEALRAVNCVFWDGDRLVGDNTDGDGFIDALRKDPGVDPAGLRCVVAGAGGAGRAVVRALASAGASDVAVVNRSPDPARHAVALAGPVGRLGQADDIPGADLVVNATPLGMGAGGADEPLPIDPSLLRKDQVVADLIYHPPMTPLLRAARDAGAIAVNGVGMLIHQAAHALGRWAEVEPPLGVMTQATLAELDRRARFDG